jgi:hypothetical protein
MSIQVKVFWGMMPCNAAVGYRRFGGPCCLKMELARSSETSVSYCNTILCHIQKTSTLDLSNLFRALSMCNDLTSALPTRLGVGLDTALHPMVYQRRTGLTYAF